MEWGAVGWNSYGLDGGSCILLSLELFGSIFRERCVVVIRPIWFVIRMGWRTLGMRGHFKGLSGCSNPLSAIMMAYLYECIRTLILTLRYENSSKCQRFEFCSENLSGGGNLAMKGLASFRGQGNDVN